MKEQERLRNRQLELENMRNKHSKSQFDQHHLTNGNLKKNEQDDFYDDEANTNDEQSDDYYYQNLYQNNGTTQLNSVPNSRLTNNNSNTNNRPSRQFFNDKTHIKIVDDYDGDGSEYVDGAAETSNKSKNIGSNLK